MESFEEVYQKYLKEVYCFLLRLSGDREIAEELTQQTFAIAFEKLENFRGECKLSVWLCQIAKHEYYAWTKKQKRYANKLDENHADQGEDLLIRKMDRSSEKFYMTYRNRTKKYSCCG